eukprot:SAG31_NODE_7209_length_1755_cov_1.355072_4_plen_53_part_00
MRAAVAQNGDALKHAAAELFGQADKEVGRLAAQEAARARAAEAMAQCHHAGL